MSTTAAAPLIHSSVTDTHSSITELMAGFFGPISPLSEATAGADSPKEDFDDGSENILTQAPTIPEIGMFPSQVPLHPDDSHQNDSEEQDEIEEVVAFPTEIDGQEVDVWKPPSSADLDTPIVAFTETTWHEADEEEEESEESELRHGGTDYLSETDLHGSQEAVQVVRWRDDGWIVGVMDRFFEWMDGKVGLVGGLMDEWVSGRLDCWLVEWMGLWRVEWMGE